MGDAELGERILSAIRTQASPRHVPNRVYQVDEIPRTLSGKKMEVPVRSHLSLLTDDQVSRIRARWEREKRVRAEKAQPAAAAPARRRRTGAPT